jgi:hypothetical protein
MKHMDTLAACFGVRALIGGVCKAATTLDEQRGIVQLIKLQELTLDARRAVLATRHGHRECKA